MSEQRFAGPDEKIDGAVYPLKERPTEKHPELTGVLEFSRSMLKAMVQQAQNGNLPVKVRLAVWPHKTGKNPPHNPYRFVKMELLYPKPEADMAGRGAEGATGGDYASPAPATSQPDDDLPW